MRGGLAILECAAAAALVAGCKEYRVEYHKRPAFYERAAMGKLPDEVTLDDGTIVKYHSTQEQSSFGRTGDDKARPFQIREESEDGKTITLHAMVPEHVLTNALTCLRNEEYQLMFDQLLADRTKQEMERDGESTDECLEFFHKHRHELVATLTRMIAGLPHEEVSITPLREGVTRCRLRPQVAEGFRFKIVDVVKEGEGLKLLMVH